MRGGMTMVGDMFNHGLKATVDSLCNELSRAFANNQIFQPIKNGSSGGNNWWPGDLGSLSSTGAQKGIRYAVSPSSFRLVVGKLLENLGQLRDAGVLTEEEFIPKTAEILARI